MTIASIAVITVPQKQVSLARRRSVVISDCCPPTEGNQGEGAGRGGGRLGRHLSSLSTFCYRQFTHVCMKTEEGSNKKKKQKIYD